ncbi:MAG: helix-turn-helix domain-containing protein [Paracoccaceae bacterium]|jgi:cytoskeletal protein RodZ
MIGRINQRRAEVKESVEPKSFDDFELRLGDIMRGERATLGKSLLDVQRDLRIKASYIAAIENSDPSVFDTPGFIAGYVRSYARYLNMDADEAFTTFCAESGFEVAHGMSADASSPKPTRAARQSNAANDPFASPNLPFTPVSEGIFSNFEPRALGSSLVLIALICGIGYGGWAVVREVQQVQVAPVDQTPTVLSQLDPLDGVTQPGEVEAEFDNADALDRLYRPQALDVPVLTARDAPISTLDRDSVGSFRTPSLPEVQTADARLPGNDIGAVPQVVEDTKPNLVMVAVRPAWVRVTAADGTHIFEAIMEPGQTFEVPLTEEPPTLRAGESGAIYFAMHGQHFGPLGARGEVSKGVVLTTSSVTETLQVADLDQESNSALRQIVAEAQNILAEEPDTE